MFSKGDVIDNRFEVKGICSTEGGMGQILFVKDNSGEIKDKIVLKYCKEKENAERFKKEIKIINSLKENPKVLSLLYSNAEYEPPYFVMKYYEKGDLTNIIENIKSNEELQEKTFLSMIDCINELHKKDVLHRDIKPQNFLLDGENIIVSDLGLGINHNSSSIRLTNSNITAGTYEYMPPEFAEGEFKHADERGDIFMLGKSFYYLLTQKPPLHITNEGINSIVFQVIAKACNPNKDNRYKNLEQLSGAIKMAYDTILRRVTNIYTIVKKLKNDIESKNNIDSSKVNEFFQKILLLEKEKQNELCLDLSTDFFKEIVKYDINKYLEEFLIIYQNMVEEADYAFYFAETIADNMKVIFFTDEITNKNKAFALDLAIRAAYLMNRFNAMDTCSNMIVSVANDDLGLYVSGIIMKNSDTFISYINPSECKCNIVMDSINAINIGAS